MKSEKRFTERIESRYKSIYARVMAIWAYCSEGVWEDHRTTLKVNIIKTVNLTVKTFLSSNLAAIISAKVYLPKFLKGSATMYNTMRYAVK